jgi:secondary thiamine-phosphate synthase enzyme
VWTAHTIVLSARKRGFHLVTSEIVTQLPELSRYEVGIAHLFIQHTSASLTINEGVDPSVRADFEHWSNDAVSEDAPFWVHTLEGPDDMPAHIKASLFGSSLLIPIRDGQFALGTWQGIYLCEHRNAGGPRSLIATLQGE